MAAVAVPADALSVPSVSTAESIDANDAAPASQVTVKLPRFAKLQRQWAYSAGKNQR